jgi:hypothetical protein
MPNTLLALGVLALGCVHTAAACTLEDTSTCVCNWHADASGCDTACQARGTWGQYNQNYQEACERSCILGDTVSCLVACFEGGLECDRVHSDYEVSDPWLAEAAKTGACLETFPTPNGDIRQWVNIQVNACANLCVDEENSAACQKFCRYDTSTRQFAGHQIDCTSLDAGGSINADGGTESGYINALQTRFTTTAMSTAVTLARSDLGRLAMSGALAESPQGRLAMKNAYNPHCPGRL